MFNRQLNGLMRSFQKDKTAKVLYYPSKISFETGNICNLRCPLCPTNSEENNSVKKGFLRLDDFIVMFDKISPFVKTIDLFSWGEPFLNPDIAGIVAYAKKKNPSVRIFIDSNLNHITDEQIRSVVDAGLDVLKVSCDGVTQAVYEKYRVGGDVDTVIKNIKRIIDVKEAQGSDKPAIIWKYLVFRHNSGEVETARRMSEEMDIGFEASGMRVDCGKEIFENVEASVSRDKEWIPEEEEFNNYKDLSSGKDFCGKPWRTFTVNWDGEVVPCGAVYDCDKYSFGNLLKEDIRKIWNGPHFVEARKTILGGSSEWRGICSVCKSNGYQFF